MKKYNIVPAGVLILQIAAVLLTGCGSSVAQSQQTASDEAGTAGSYVILKGIADATPHAEILEHVEPELEKQGIKIDLVATQSDETTNEKLAKGEIDFDYFQHWPYLQEWDKANGYDLVDAGDIHIEPITAYSDKYSDKDQIPDNAVVAIPNDGTNEYRALSILEQNGFIKLNETAKNSLSASVNDITEYTKPVKIVEIDSAQIIPTKDDYDFFITNTNKVLESGIKSNRLFSEGSDSPYANIIATRAEDRNNPAIVTLVKVLQSEDTKKFIEEKYNGAVIPAEASSEADTTQSAASSDASAQHS